MRERRQSLFAIIGILLVLVFLGVAFTLVNTKGSATSAKEEVKVAKVDCTGCHEMAPEVLTWQISSHSKIPCTSCHQVKPEDFKAQHDSGQIPKPIKLEDGIPNSVCEQCHTTNREATPSGDLIIPHDKHAAMGVACVKCHSGVVHAGIEKRGLTNDYEKWTPDTARQAATRTFLSPSMWICINCHKQANVTRKCSACHTAIPSLPSHDLPTWKSQHGKVARTNIGECTKCHVTPGQPKFVTPSTGDLAADFARAQEFCYTCHLKRPEMHEKSMFPIHPAKVAERGVQNCLTCHNRDQKTDPKVTGTYCNQCHWMPDNSAKPAQNTQ